MYVLGGFFFFVFRFSVVFSGVFLLPILLLLSWCFAILARFVCLLRIEHHQVKSHAFRSNRRGPDHSVWLGSLMFRVCRLPGRLSSNAVGESAIRGGRYRCVVCVFFSQFFVAFCLEFFCVVFLSVFLFIFRVFYRLVFFFFSSSGGLVKTKLKLTTLPRRSVFAVFSWLEETSAMSHVSIESARTESWSGSVFLIVAGLLYLKIVTCEN